MISCLYAPILWQGKAGIKLLTCFLKPFSGFLICVWNLPNDERREEELGF